LVLFIALANTQSASAVADVKIATLDCDSDPQVVEITNSGDEAQDLTGWELQSDPADEQIYDLSSIGTLAPGSSVFIEAGPDAESTFTWSTETIFRAGDPDDFARIVDNEGQTRSQEACAAEAQPTTSPEPTATAAPAASPTTAPADGVPDGGGPPTDAADALLAPLTAVVAGASLATLGSLALAAVWLGGSTTLLKRREAPVFELPAPPAPIVSSAQPLRAPRATEPLAIALVVSLLAAILVALLLTSSARHK
jgi:hypothetical protein